MTLLRKAVAALDAFTAAVDAHEKGPTPDTFTAWGRALHAAKFDVLQVITSDRLGGGFWVADLLRSLPLAALRELTRRWRTILDDRGEEEIR